MRAIAGAIAVLAVCLELPAHAGEWAQILGPARNGIAQNEKLADKWPNDGPKTPWQRPVGHGFAGVAVSGGLVILYHGQGDDVAVEALNAKSGKPIWRHGIPTKYVPSFTSDRGPRSVPLMHGENVYLYGPQGMLTCLSVKSGDEVWQRDTYEDFCSKRPKRGEPPEGYFGFGSAPIVEGDALLLNVGGGDADAGIVAFNLKTGATVWKSTKERASYSSPVAANIGGRRHLIFATRLSVLSVDPTNGQVLFKFPFGRLGPAVTAANPVVFGSHVFITGSYNFGATLSKIGPTGSQIVWESDEVLSSQYTTPILLDGVMYGIHGRQDAGIAALRCIDPETRRILWTKDGFGYATLLLADGKLLALKTDGELVLLRPDKARYVELDRFRPFTDTTRALPALSNGLLYARDTSTLKCIDLGR